MFLFIHKIKPVINGILKKLGLYVLFHSIIIKLLSKREKLSKQYIRGKGLEIGALHTPLKIYNNAKVTYIDRLDTKGLRKHYPELHSFHFVPVGFVDDGEKLKKIKANSQDFIIANHFIEHCEDPITTIKNHLRVLKNNGILYYAVPDKRYTFDLIRKTTTTVHLKTDYEKGPKQSRKQHYEEWSKVILHLKGKDAEKKTIELMNSSYSIHFHTWTLASFKSMLSIIKNYYHFPFEVVNVVPNINEFIVIIKKNKL